MIIGIDIGKFRHQAAFLDDAGKELRASLPFDNSEDGFRSFFDALSAFKDKNVVIGMEATGHYWLNLYGALLARDLETHVVNPIQTEAARRMSIRKTKTDSVDCRYIAQVIRMGDYSDVSQQASDIAELRQLCRYRYSLVDTMSAVKNQITGIMDRIFPEYSPLFDDIFGASSLALLQRYPTPEAIRKVPLKRLCDLLKKHSRGALGLERAKQLKEAAKHSVGIGADNPAFTFQLSQQLQLIEFTQSQLKPLEDRITSCYEKFPCFLHTIPGVGVVSAAVILSEVGDISLFSNPKKLVAFAGIDPSVHQSGNFSASISHMSKRGSPYLRRALWNAAQSAYRFNPAISQFYLRKRAEGKNHMTSIGACSRKLCYIVFAILSSNSPFIYNLSS